MNKSILEQLEFERSKRDLIKIANERKTNTTTTFNPRGIDVDGERKFAWEYELERYRKDRIKDRFCIAGAVCGITSLILTLYFHWSAILPWFH